MKLNGWHRIGIVLSVCWMIGAAIHTRNAEVEYADTWHEFQLQGCFNSLHTTDTQACIDSANESYQENLEPTSVTAANIAVSALSPVIAAWVLTFIAIRIVRWVRAGFVKAKPWL